MARKRSTKTAIAAAVGAADPNPTVETQEAPQKRSGPTVAEMKRHFDKCYQAFLDIQAAQSEVSSAKGFYGEMLKEAKKAGCGDLPPLKEAIKLKHQNKPEEASRHFEAVNQWCVIGKVAISARPVQLGLFADGQSIATKIENDNLQETKDKEFNEDSAEELGYRAGLAGKSTDTNPHFDKDDGADGSPESLRWIAGHKRGQKENMAAFQKNGKPAAGAPAH